MKNMVSVLSVDNIDIMHNRDIMEELIKNINKVKEKKSLTNQEIAHELEITEDKLTDILTGNLTLEEQEIDKINDIIKQKFKPRKVTKMICCLDFPLQYLLLLFCYLQLMAIVIYQL